MEGLLDREIRYTLQEVQENFNAFTQWEKKSPQHTLDATFKAKSSRLQGHRNGQMSQKEGEKDHEVSITVDFRAPLDSIFSGFYQIIDQQERHTKVMEKVLETHTRLLSKSCQPRFESRSPEGFRSTRSAMQCYNCQEFEHLPIQCPQKSTKQPGISRNSDTDRQAIVKSILQRANPEQDINSNIIQAEAILGPTVYVMVTLDV